MFHRIVRTSCCEHARYDRSAAVLENSQKISASTMRKRILFVVQLLPVCPYLRQPVYKINLLSKKVIEIKVYISELVYLNVSGNK